MANTTDFSYRIRTYRFFFIVGLLLGVHAAGCCSARIFVTFGPKCDFTPYDLRENFEAVVAAGTDEEIAKTIHIFGSSSRRRLIFLTKEVDSMSLLKWQYGYDHVHLNCKFRSAINKLKKTLEITPKTDADLTRLTPKEAGLFYDLMMRVDRVLKKYNITYWATCGTLLGAVRHQGMIPWDDDLDIAIFEEDLPRLEGLRDVLDKEGLSLCFHPKYEYYKICLKDGKPIINSDNGTTYEWTYPAIDIFHLGLSEGVYTYVTDRWRDHYRDKDHFTKKELRLPLKRCIFGPLTIPVPHNPKRYLRKMYGRDWNKVAYVVYSHKREEFLPKIKVDLVDRSPPRYVLPRRLG